MAHRYWAKLGRKSSHRRALLRNLVTALFKHERIETTLPKAKAAQRMADRVVTLAKRGEKQDRLDLKRKAANYLFEQEARSKLFRVLVPRYESRNGGFTRVARTRFRRGDAALMAYVEMVDREGELRQARPPTPQKHREAPKGTGTVVLVKDLPKAKVVPE